MDENLQAKMDEARAAGYSDEEIQAFLNPKKEEPVAQSQATPNEPVSPWVDRSQEKQAIGDYAGAQAIKYSLEGAAGLAAANKLAKTIRGPVAPPAAPTTFTGGANPAFDAALSQPAGQQPSLMQRAGQIASKYAPTAAKIGTGIGLATYSPGLNAGEQEELIKIRAREEAARRAGLIK